MNKKPKKDLLREIAEEIDAVDDMLTSLVELLEEKGILTQQEWENRIKSKIEKGQRKKKYRDIQFDKTP